MLWLMLLWLLISTALAADKLFYSSVVDFLSILCPSRPFPALLLSKLTNQPTTPRKTFNRYSIQQIRFWQTNINCPDNNIFYRSKVHEMNLKNNCHPHFYSSPGKGFAWVLYYIYWIHPTQPHYILQKWRWQLRYEGECEGGGDVSGMFVTSPIMEENSIADKLFLLVLHHLQWHRKVQKGESIYTAFRPRPNNRKAKRLSSDWKTPFITERNFTSLFQSSSPSNRSKTVH